MFCLLICVCIESYTATKHYYLSKLSAMHVFLTLNLYIHYSKFIYYECYTGTRDDLSEIICNEKGNTTFFMWITWLERNQLAWHAWIG